MLPVSHHFVLKYKKRNDSFLFSVDVIFGQIYLLLIQMRQCMRENHSWIEISDVFFLFWLFFLFGTKPEIRSKQEQYQVEHWIIIHLPTNIYLDRIDFCFRFLDIEFNENHHSSISMGFYINYFHYLFKGQQLSATFHINLFLNIRDIEYILLRLIHFILFRKFYFIHCLFYK